MKKLFGKYRGVVIGNIDPMAIGRVQVRVPDAGGAADPAGWAMPCVPLAGPSAGIATLPPVGANIWVEFERGDPQLPIWVGGFWNSAAEVPATLSGGGIVLSTASGASLVVDDAGIRLQNGKGASIALTGPTVSVNQGALEVT